MTVAFLGDTLIFLFSMILVLYIRYSHDSFKAQFEVHTTPFLIILALWLIIFYIANLYTYKAFQNILEIARRTSTTLVISFFITITIFYIFSRFFFLTPKANLVIFTITFGILDIAWRYLLMKAFIKKSNSSNILILASSPLVKMVTEHISSHPQLGYSIYTVDPNTNDMIQTIKENNIATIVIDGQSLKNNITAKALYKILPKQIEIVMFTDFYESLFGCIPLSELEEEWFIREITDNKNIYESTKRLLEIVSICLTAIITIPILAIIAILVAITSKGPIIYKQERIGKDNRPFILYKFRTMKINQQGPLWTENNDSRITLIGKILRRTHLDEMPQLLNVLKGDISFIGPRAERTELVKAYAEIPYYEIRHIIKPGLIGWAQLNYQASTSLEEAKKKFQFDLYYLKNRSFILDLFILIKTIRKVF
jgi:exopolysaccharide biosynthesis polyprenyl glycosylphosphotransferase